MEYDIKFLPKDGASMVPLDKVYESKQGADGESTYEWEHIWDETLIEKYGEPFVINFDEYAKINDSDNETKEKLLSEVKVIQSGDDENETSKAYRTYYKWPLPWSRSDYSFGYNNRQDFNMYMITSHSSTVPYHIAARKFSGNRAGDGKGLYDVSYYKSMPAYNRDKIDNPAQGYFYYVNAASDPGVSARLEINELCQGSTIIVSAWMSEFSEDKETANLSFNFVAVMKDDSEYNDKIISAGIKPGDRLTLHKFITGYIPGEESLKLGCTSEAENNSKDARGKWLNVYYSFVPRLAEFSSTCRLTLRIRFLRILPVRSECDSTGENGSREVFGKCYASAATPTTRGRF